MSALLASPPQFASDLDVPSDLVLASGAVSDAVTIRGVRLPIAELVDRSLFTPARREQLRAQLLAGKPFPNLVIDGIFNPKLLELVVEEFDTHPRSGWFDVKSKNEAVRRSTSELGMGPATQIYFDTVSAGWFTDWLSSIIGVPYLLPDPKLWGGGLHESKTGARFAVHRDFNRHPVLGLKNEMVFITYLNKGWQPEWGSALELWDKKADRCEALVQPEFGRTILLPHGPEAYHGHTQPLKAPDDRPRRSVAAYFYSSPLAGTQHGVEAGTLFMRNDRVDQVKKLVRNITPPVLYTMGRKLMPKVRGLLGR